MDSVKPVKTLDYLANKDRKRLIVAGKYLQNDNIAFVDRKNSTLIVTNAEDESFQEIDLNVLLPKEYRSNPKKIPKPSDVNKGFEEDQIFITFTGDTFSVAVACQFRREDGNISLSPPLQIVKINKRTRSVIALDRTTVCADTEYEIIIKNKDDNDDRNVITHSRVKRDRGGLLMTDGQGNIYFGDGEIFVGCYWDGERIKERFRCHGLKFPRGSAISSHKKRIFICTDSSCAIFSIAVDHANGDEVKRENYDTRLQYGDIDFNSEGKKFFTTFWQENEWPVLYEIRP